MTNRRDFLKQVSLFTAGGLLAGKASTLQAATAPVSAPVTTAGKRIGLQVYSLQNEVFDDLPKRMKELKDMGYATLELAGYNNGKIGKVDMMEYKKVANDAGLQIISSHVNPSVEGVPFLREYTKELKPQIMEYWKKTAADHAKLGCKYLIQPMMPKCETHDDAKLICEIFNEAGEIVKAAGLPVVFHVHDEVVIDAQPWDTEDAMLARVCGIMGEPIPWAPDLPLKAAGWVGRYFTKD